MNADECLDRFGLSPPSEQLHSVREILEAQAQRERMSQGDGDTELMKLCCVQLFNGGLLDDVLRIWGAKTSSMDADASIDIQLLCGAGLEKTKKYLAEHGSGEAHAALKRLLASEASGDFDGFSVDEYARSYARYYEDDE